MPAHSATIVSVSHTEKPPRSGTLLASRTVVLDVEAKDRPFLPLPSPHVDWERGKVTSSDPSHHLQIGGTYFLATYTVAQGPVVLFLPAQQKCAAAVLCPGADAE